MHFGPALAVIAALSVQLGTVTASPGSTNHGQYTVDNDDDNPSSIEPKALRKRQDDSDYCLELVFDPDIDTEGPITEISSYCVSAIEFEVTCGWYDRDDEQFTRFIPAFCPPGEYCRDFITEFYDGMPLRHAYCTNVTKPILWTCPRTGSAAASILLDGITNRRSVKVETNVYGFVNGRSQPIPAASINYTVDHKSYGSMEDTASLRSGIIGLNKGFSSVDVNVVSSGVSDGHYLSILSFLIP